MAKKGKVSREDDRRSKVPKTDGAQAAIAPCGLKLRAFCRQSKNLTKKRSKIALRNDVKCRFAS